MNYSLHYITLHISHYYPSMAQNDATFIEYSIGIQWGEDVLLIDTSLQYLTFPGSISKFTNSWWSIFSSNLSHKLGMKISWRFIPHDTKAWNQDDQWTIWSMIEMINDQDDQRSMIKMINDRWSMIKMSNNQFTPVITMINELNDPWSRWSMINDQDDQWSRWSMIKMINDQDDQWSRWSMIKMINDQDDQWSMNACDHDQ